MPVFNALGRTRTGRTDHKMSVYVPRERFGDVEFMETEAKRRIREVDMRYVGWEWDDHPTTVDLDQDAIATARNAGHPDPGNSWTRTMVGHLSDELKDRVKTVADIAAFKTELEALAAQFAQVAKDLNAYLESDLSSVQAPRR